MPLHTLRADIDYATATARTTFGAIGVKVWIYNGEIFGLRIKHALGQLENPLQLRALRRDVARVKTLLCEHGVEERSVRKRQTAAASKAAALKSAGGKKRQAAAPERATSAAGGGKE